MSKKHPENGTSQISVLDEARKAEIIFFLLLLLLSREGRRISMANQPTGVGAAGQAGKQASPGAGKGHYAAI